jgi:membrane associated rhomboid family serine protease
MIDTGTVGLILILANIIFSYQGLTNEAFFDGYKLDVDKILISKDYKRIISSGFLHVSWRHLLFNMLSLYAFSVVIDAAHGGIQFLIIYFSGLIGGGILAVYLHRHHGDYSAVGASGAVCGVIFAAIALYPGIGIGFFGLPFSIPGWLYGILFLLYSVYGIKSKTDNIGHEAHLGGALLGMIAALIMNPSALADNYVTIMAIAVPAVGLMYIIVARPDLLMIDNLFFKRHKNSYSIDHLYNERKHITQKEIDKILDKINKKGMKSLSLEDRIKLKKYSKTK